MPSIFVPLCITITPTSTLLSKLSRSTRLIAPERKPEAEARSSQFVNSRREIPMTESLPVTPDCEVESALASRRELALVPNSMLKSPRGDVYNCWRTLLLQTRSTITLFGTGVPSSVATRPRRYITRSPAGSIGSGLGRGEFAGRFGGPEGGG